MTITKPNIFTGCQNLHQIAGRLSAMNFTHEHPDVALKVLQDFISTQISQHPDDYIQLCEDNRNFMRVPVAKWDVIDKAFKELPAFFVNPPSGDHVIKIRRDNLGILAIEIIPEISTPDLGTPVQAISFALDHIDDAWTDRCEFLKAWVHGDLSEWPDFKAFIGDQNTDEDTAEGDRP